MRLEIRGEYPIDWAVIARATKEAAGWKCVRCRHDFEPGSGRALACTTDCDRDRCRHPRIAERQGVHVLTVHHLDGDKGNCRWWNLLSLCNACHLSVQARVVVERAWLFPHSEWFIPYVCGFYAHFYAAMDISRAAAEADPGMWLALGQPWLAAERAARGA